MKIRVNKLRHVIREAIREAYERLDSKVAMQKFPDAWEAARNLTASKASPEHHNWYMRDGELHTSHGTGIGDVSYVWQNNRWVKE